MPQYIINPHTQELDAIWSDKELGILADAAYLRLDTTNGPLLGALAITPPDTTSDPLFQIVTTGTDQYGLEINTYDLTGAGFGKFPYIHALTNGAITNMMAMDSLVIGDINVSSLLGQSFTFLRTADLQTMQITANFDGGGTGVHQMTFNDDVVFQQDCTVDGTLTAGTLSLAALSIGQNTATRPTITFDALNNDGSLVYHDSGGGVPVRWELHSSTNASDVWIDRSLGMFGNTGLSHFEFTNSIAVGNEYSDYNAAVGGQAGYIAHKFQHLATNMDDTAYMVRMFNMSNPGYMFGVKSRGQLELGSTTGTDTDISITFNGGVGGSVGKLTYMEDEDYFSFADDILIPQGERIYLDDVNSSLYDNGTNVVLASSNNMYFLPAGGQFVIGNSEAGIDFSLKFDGENSNGIITWMEDEGYFVFDNNVSIEGTIATDNNEFVATDYIRHVITTVEASAGNFTEAWTKAGTSEIMAIDAIWHDVGSGVVWADEWTSGTDPAVKYDGANFTTYRQIGAGAWAYPDEIVIEVKYTK